MKTNPALEMIDGLNCISEVIALVLLDDKDTWLVCVVCGLVHLAGSIVTMLHVLSQQKERLGLSVLPLYFLGQFLGQIK